MKTATQEMAPRFIESGSAFADLSGLTAQESARSATRPQRPSGDASVGRERFDVVVIGGGQAGLSVGYHLARRGVRFVILDASERVGDTWRKRWDSLRLFTPARFDSLDGMPFPAPGDSFPTKDEMANYLEAYAARFQLPVRSGFKVDKLSKSGEGYVIKSGDVELEAKQVVVAMSNYQAPRAPSFARELDPSIVQLHSSEYRNPSQLKKGAVLVAGAGNSGAEVALELSRHHETWMSGRATGHVPFRIAGFWGRLILVRLVLRVFFHRVMTIKTPIGRKVRAKLLTQGGPLIRVKPEDLAAAGVRTAPKVVGVRDGLPLLQDGRILDVKNVVWCTGFDQGLSWINLPIFGDYGEPSHDGGVVTSEPGLYFVGRLFLYAGSSVMVHGVGRDAARIAGVVAARAR